MNSRNKYLLLISASPKTAARPSPRGDGRQPSRALREPPGVNPKLASNVALFGVTEIEGGFPHSEILGSKPVRGSPRLIAAYHVLHRLSAPRHPPDTLKTLDCSHCQRAPLVEPPNPILRSPSRTLPIRLGSLRTLPSVQGSDGVGLLKRPFCFKRIREF